MRASHERPLPLRIVSQLAWPLVLLYAMAVRLKNAAFDFGLSKPRHLDWPVISVGNLSVGGTGKTPLVLSLVRLLEARGWKVDVLSRGYGRSSAQISRVDPQGAFEIFGDEPLLMARCGASVYVGADRRQAGLLAEREAAAQTHALHILDDGFQHRKLSRVVDIVLLQRADLQDEMLPLGRLREPLSALERADICILRAEDADLKNRALALMRHPDPARIWIVERRTTFPAASPVLASPAHRVLAFCAIGDPQGFFCGLRNAGITVTKEIAFRDHHRYTQKDIERLRADARQSGAQYFLTTEKDSMRLTADLRAKLEKELPLVVAGLEVFLCDEAAAMATLESLLAVARPQPLQDQTRNVR